ncbi:MAG: NERD domain-containing protein [Candidatus Calescibacterium sp.]|nr:NERD domain-containing protein [Candidatus Calescibacterium sp.]MCX7971862.1 NERD domain-containing protein [bacterium]MDW8195039.1 NERD domain-containing protein [Candidatus Calescibacterium sp.]
MARVFSPPGVSTHRMETHRRNVLILLYLVLLILIILLSLFFDKLYPLGIIPVSFVLAFVIYYILLFSKRIKDAKIGANAEKYLSDFLDNSLPATYWIINDLKLKYGNIDCLVIDTIKNCIFLIEVKASRRFNSAKVAKWVKQCNLSEKLLKHLISKILSQDVPIFKIISLPFLQNQGYFYHFEDSDVRLLGNQKLIEFIQSVPMNKTNIDWYKFVDDICNK